MRIKRSSIVPLFVILFAACNKPGAPDCFKTTGDQVTELRYPGTFRTVVLYSDVDLVLVQGNETKVEVMAGQNLQKKILTTVNAGVLEIDNSNGCNFVRGYKKRIEVKVTLPDLRKIVSKGVGSISMQGGFTQDSLELSSESIGDIEVEGVFFELVVNTGSNGDVYLNGSANRLYIYTSGVDYVHGEKIGVSDYLYVNTNNLGDCTVNVDQTDLFEYMITNSGNIYYQGVADKITDLGNGSAKGKAIQK